MVKETNKVEELSQHKGSSSLISYDKLLRFAPLKGETSHLKL